jgi:hypothetical protein
MVNYVSKLSLDSKFRSQVQLGNEDKNVEQAPSPAFYQNSWERLFYILFFISGLKQPCVFSLLPLAISFKLIAYSL